jgi:nucleotide-binding universal stress UspA family protein
MTNSGAFGHILVPVDFIPADQDAVEAGRALEVGNQALEFSPASEESVRLAAAVARGSGGTIRLLHATPAMNLGSMYHGPVSVPANVVEEIHERAKTLSLTALEALRDRHCEGLTTELVAKPGVPLDLVLAEAKLFGADLIVMAASGRSRVARFFVGSTVDRVVRQADCPVLVVPTARE